MGTPTKVSSKCVQLVSEFEGLRLTSYKDSVGVWTIGYGRTMGVAPGQTCTAEEAATWLQTDLDSFAKSVHSSLTWPVNQNQFDALVSLAYNIGMGSFNTSTLLKLINHGDLEEAAGEFEKWDKSGGVEMSGLERRRLAEKKLYLS